MFLDMRPPILIMGSLMNAKGSRQQYSGITSSQRMKNTRRLIVSQGLPRSTPNNGLSNPLESHFLGGWLAVCLSPN